MVDSSKGGGPAAVETTGLVRRFGDFTAVDRLDLRVEPRSTRRSKRSTAVKSPNLLTSPVVSTAAGPPPLLLSTMCPTPPVECDDLFGRPYNLLAQALGLDHLDLRAEAE